MNRKRSVRLVTVGEYVAEVEVELIYTEEGWSPYLSLEDALKLDEMRRALEEKDLERALRLGRVYRLSPVVA